MRKRIVVVGSNFAGLTAALKIKEQLRDAHEVAVYSKSPDFLFMPSMIWVPFGLRDRKQITFPLAPLYKKKEVEFTLGEVTQFDLEQRQIRFSPGAGAGSEQTAGYDYLVIATGPELNYEAVPGLGPRQGHTQSIFAWEDAAAAHTAFERWLAKPGPVVIGAVQGASCFGAAYEFLFNFAYQLRRHKLEKKVPLTYMTAEPFLAHFGLGGFGNAQKMTEQFFKMLGIQAELNAKVREITQDEIRLEDGRKLPFTYSMLAPAFRGVPAVRAAKDITNQGGWVKTDGYYRTEPYSEVYAAGVAVALNPPAETPVPCGVPKTGYLSEEMAKVAAHNIVADIQGHHKVALPPGSIDAKCVLDAGNMGIIMSADHFLEPREHTWLIPGPEAHWAKLAFEKYFLTTRKRGMV
jgi:sulfide:quinone oxidoreductase